MQSQNTLPTELLRLVRSQAAKFFDGEISSADAFAAFKRALDAGYHGNPVNEMHAEFDRAVGRLIDAA